MISNCRNIPQQKTKPKQLRTCLHNKTTRDLSPFLVSEICTQSSKERTMSKVSTLTASVAESSANKKPTIKPPMEAVIVNSIIYSKPSFCTISVDLGDVPINKKSANNAKMTNGSCPNKIDCFKDSVCSSLNFEDVSRMMGMPNSSTLEVDEDAKLYRMCTTLNGSIHHQISDLCDNILAMAGFYNNRDDEHDEEDDDNFIEFSYRDNLQVGFDDDDDDEEEDDEFSDNEAEVDYNDEVDDDYDVVDFSYDCPIEPQPKLCCDKRKKVRFSAKPTVHKMHAWSYAYRAARKGEWEMYARDRERFKLRIQRAALTLNPILEREHRQKIYEKRFANLYDKIDSQIEDSVVNTESKETSIDTESKKPHQKKKRRKRRFCKMGNKHYF